MIKIIKVIGLDYGESKFLRWPFLVLLLYLTVICMFNNLWLQTWYNLPLYITFFYITFSLFRDYASYKEALAVLYSLSDELYKEARMHMDTKDKLENDE